MIRFQRANGGGMITIVPILMVFLLFLGASTLLSSPPPRLETSQVGHHDQESGSGPDHLGPLFPTVYGVQQTGALNAAFNSLGGFGLGFIPGPPDITQWPKVSFNTPPGSVVDYLFGGAIWVGGIVNGDTLVAPGYDGWQLVGYLYPPAYTSSNRVGSVTEIPPVGDDAMRAEYSDTIHAGINYPLDLISGRPYTPLHINVATRSHIWRSAPANNCVLYDVVVTNIGTQTIDSGVIGLYFKTEIGMLSNPSRYLDDVSGSLRDSGIAYAIDNDGDFTQPQPATKIFACKLLAISFNAHDTSYNWWRSSGIADLDFGPRLVAGLRNFGTGGLGTPEGMANKYYIMRHREWDYDQVKTLSAARSDPAWVPGLPGPDSIELESLSRGCSTQFLLSFGSFQLPPDSSIRFLFTTFTADSVHVDPNNGQYITDPDKYDPDRYLAGLNFSNVFKNARVASSLGQLLLNPANPVTGLHVAYRSKDTVTIEWDDWVYPNIDGYNIYLNVVPNTAIPFPGVIPPWYQGPTTNPFDQVGRGHRYTFSGIDSTKPYSCNVALRTSNQVGSIGQPVPFRFAVEPPAPVLLDSIIYFKQAQGALLRWHQIPGTTTHHFNIYKFDSTWAANKFLPNYTTAPRSFEATQLLVHNGKDYFFYSYPIYAQANADESTFVDVTARDNDIYAIVAVDSQGYSSPYSNEAKALESTHNKDVLVIYNSNASTGHVQLDSIRDYYSRLLHSNTFDLFNWYDSLAVPGCDLFNPRCIDWHEFMHYRLILIDGGLDDAVLTSQFEDTTLAFTTYLLSGGRLAYFGSFSRFDTPAFSITTAPRFYSRKSQFVQRFFGIDSVFDVGFLYYKNHSTTPYVDSLFGFHRGEAVLPAPVDITYDSLNYRLNPLLLSYWPVSSPPSVSTFHLNADGQRLFSYRSLDPAKSMNEGQPVGVLTSSPEGTTYLFGFHLWYLDSLSAQGLIDWLISQAPPAPASVAAQLPKSTALLAQNYPNPFNPSTTISFAIPFASHVTLDVFNVLGQKVISLVNANFSAGEHKVLWNGTNTWNQLVASGIYFYRLHAGDQITTKKMILLK